MWQDVLKGFICERISHVASTGGDRQQFLTRSNVAREFGLPALVNIPGQLESVKDGQPVMADDDQYCTLQEVVREQGN